MSNKEERQVSLVRGREKTARAEAAGRADVNVLVKHAPRTATSPVPALSLFASSRQTNTTSLVPSSFWFTQDFFL